MSKHINITKEKEEQIERGKRIRDIRENELRLNKTDLAKLIGVSSQFLGLVESGNGNLSYRSIKLLRKLSKRSSDYILFGLDDSVINETKELFKDYTNDELLYAFDTLIHFASFVKNRRNTSS